MHQNASRRRLAAILAADVVGFSKLMGADEEGTLARIRSLRREIVEPNVQERNGRIVKTTGDGFLIEFPSPVEAVRCALAIQEALASSEASQETSQPIQMRIGINLGDILIEPDGDIYGDGVNVAARLEQLAEPGGVCISGAVHEVVRDRVAIAFEDRGEQQVKNIARPIRLYSTGSGATKHSSPHQPLPLPDKPSIAVLPFTNMSGDPEQEYFADGVVEDIITALSRMRWFFVIARNSSFTYKGRSVDIRQVGHELGVRYVLEGSVRKSGQRLRITGQLVDSTNGQHIWADKFDGLLEDVFDLQDHITRSVVGAVEPTLRFAEMGRSRAKRTTDLGAYDLFLKALSELSTYSEPSLLEAERLLRTALARDPNYGDAWAVLATTTFFRRVGGFLSLDEGGRLASEAAYKAVSCDPQNPSALASAASVLANLGLNLDEAVEFADRAVSLAPTSAPVLTFCAVTYNFNGDFDKALSLAHQARRLSPRDPRGFVVLSQITTACFFCRRFEEAAEWARRNLEQHPDFAPSWRFYASALAHAGRVKEAQEAVLHLRKVQPNSTLNRAATTPYRYPWMVDLYVGGLRIAGLPE